MTSIRAYAALACACLSLTLAGCGSSSPEDRINEALPVGFEVKDAKTRLDALAEKFDAGKVGSPGTELEFAL